MRGAVSQSREEAGLNQAVSLQAEAKHGIIFQLRCVLHTHRTSDLAKVWKIGICGLQIRKVLLIL